MRTCFEVCFAELVDGWKVALQPHPGPLKYVLHMIQDAHVELD